MQSYFVVSIIYRNLSLTWTAGSWSFCICIQYTWRTSVYNFCIQTLTRRTRTFVEYAQNVTRDFVGGLNANAHKGYPTAMTHSHRTCSDSSQSCSRVPLAAWSATPTFLEQQLQCNSTATEGDSAKAAKCWQKTKQNKNCVIWPRERT